MYVCADTIRNCAVCECERKREREGEEDRKSFKIDGNIYTYKLGCKFIDEKFISAHIL